MKSTVQRFTATLLASKTKTVIELPFDPDTVWGTQDRHHVEGTVGGRHVRGALVPTALGYTLSLGPRWLEDNGIAPGMTVDVMLAPLGPLIEQLDADIAGALEAEPKAAMFFRSIAPFYRKNLLRWIMSAKRPETRAARIAEGVKQLAAGELRR